MIKLIPQHLKIITNILKKHSAIQQVLAYGSRTKDTAVLFSDLDLCIVHNKLSSLELLGDLREAFSESDLPFRVDLVDWATINPEFKQVITKHSIELYKK